ncbi:MAG: type II toxin-antitoxin system YafQ family toxin [Janthinobacterium lividum]
MRAIEPTGRFRKDFKRECKGQHRTTLDDDLSAVLSALREDSPLAVGYRDHALSGEWKGCRDCHIKPDLVLIYRLLGVDTLQLMRLGSHAELFGS